MSMTGYELTVIVPSADTFNAYWYGVGSVTNAEPIESSGRPYVRYTVDYGTDRYRCRYQADRFASGLYFAEVKSYSTDDVPF